MSLELTRRAVTAGLLGLPVAATARLPRRIANVEGDVMTLANGLVRRVLRLPTPDRPRLATTDYRPVAERSRFFSGAKEEWTSHDAFSFRQDLEGFGEPAEGSWDGFQRINTETGSGGLLGIFRHGAREESRRLFVSWLDPDRRYAVRRVDGSEAMRATGRRLRETGMEVVIAELYGGELFEIAALG